MKTRIRRAEIVATAARASQLPPPNPEWHEVALLGRSNVGKSSLLNKLVRRKQLARTSSTPGKTRLIHVYEVDLGSFQVGEGLNVAHKQRFRRQFQLRGEGHKQESQKSRKDG